MPHPFAACCWCSRPATHWLISDFGDCDPSCLAHVLVWGRTYQEVLPR